MPERSFWGKESPKIFFPEDDAIRTYNFRCQEAYSPWTFYIGEYDIEMAKQKISREKHLKKLKRREEIEEKLARLILFERWRKFSSAKKRKHFFNTPRSTCPWCDIEDPWWTRCTSCEFYNCLEPLDTLRHLWIKYPYFRWE